MRILIFSIIFVIASAISISPQNIQKYDGFRIKSINYGSSAIDDFKISTALKNKVGDKFNSAYLISDIAEILNSGYLYDLDAYITQNKDRSLDINFDLFLNPKIASIEFSAFSISNYKSMVGLLENKLDQPINYLSISADIKNIEEHYHKQGYLLAEVTNVVFIKNLKTLFFSIDEGKIDKIEINGLKEINKKLVIRELSAKQGNLLKVNDLVKDRENIVKLGYFSKVSNPKIMSSQTALGLVDILYDVTERKINHIQIGLEQLQDNKLSVALNLKFPNFRNTGEGLFFKGQSIIESGFRDYNYYWKYREPWLFSNKLPLNILGWYQNNQENLDATTQMSVIRHGWEVNIEPQLFEHLRTVIGFKNEVVDDQSNTILPYSKSSMRFVSLFSTVKNFSNPQTGRRIYFELEKGADIFSLVNFGGVDFSKTVFEMSYFYNFIKKDVLALNLSTGWLDYKNQQLFEQDKFLLGGAYSLRGYPDSYSDNANAILGNKKIVINVEYRMTFSDLLQGVVFLDWGNAFDDQPDFSKFKFGRGVGLRIFTPLAPIRFDFALGEDNQFMLHFGLGQLF